MKKLATVLGVGAISMAVALSPAVAQVKAPETSGAPAAVQSTPTDKTALPGSAKEEKKPAAKGAIDNKSATTPAKPSTDIKADSKAVPAKPAPDVKTDKAAPAKPDTAGSVGMGAKTGSDTKSDVATKPSVPSKTDAVSTKAGDTVKSTAHKASVKGKKAVKGSKAASKSKAKKSKKAVHKKPAKAKHSTGKAVSKSTSN